MLIEKGDQRLSSLTFNKTIMPDIFQAICCIKCGQANVVMTRRDVCIKCGTRLYPHNELDDIIEKNKKENPFTSIQDQIDKQWSDLKEDKQDDIY